MFSIEALCLTLTVLVLSMKNNAVGTEPMIEHGYACKSTLELSCGSSINSSNGFWTFYRNQSNDIQNMAKIIYNDNKCTVKTSYSIDCKCISGYRVNCIIYNSTVGNTSDRWRCSKFSDGSTNFSTEIRLPTQEMSDCATTIDPENFTEDGRTFTTVLNINRESMTITQAEEHSSTTTGPYANNTEKMATEGFLIKHDNMQLIMLVAGPFVVFDIGFVVFVYRKKLVSYVKRHPGNHAVILTNINVNHAAEGHANVEANINNAAHWNCNAALRNPASTCKTNDAPNDVERQCALQSDGRADGEIEDCLDDDPLYSRVKDNITSTLRCPETDANTQRGAANGPADFKFDILLDDDPLYSCVVEQISTHEDDEGACGYTDQVRTHILTDQLYPDNTNAHRHRASEHNGNRPNNKLYTDNQLYGIINNVPTFATGDLLYSKVGKDDIGAHSNTANRHYSVENDDISFAINRNDDEPHYRLTIENNDNDDQLNSNAAKGDPVYSVIKQCDAQNSFVKKDGSSDASACFDDSLLSEFGRKRNIDVHASEWNCKVPPTPMCSASNIPTYSKVIQKNKHVVALSYYGTASLHTLSSCQRLNPSSWQTLTNLSSMPKDYTYSVVKKTKRDQTDSVDDSTTRKKP